MTKLPVAEWFIAAMAEGIGRLLVLSKRGAPPFEFAHLTAAEWAKQLWSFRAWSITVDPARIEEAFTTLSRTCGAFFPQAMDLYEALGKREPPKDWRRPHKPISEEGKAQIREMIHDLQHKLDYAEQLDREKADAKVEEQKRRSAAARALDGKEGSDVRPEAN